MFKLNFCTPDKKLVSDQEFEEVTLPTFAGELNILPGHAPLLTTLTAGILKFKLKGESSQKFAICKGYCQVSADGVNVLADSAVVANEVNPSQASNQLKEQELKLVGESLSDEEWQKTQDEISKLKAELDLVQNTNQ